MKKTTIAIVGLGLIGGSLAQAARKCFGSRVRITGFSRNPAKILQAKRKGLIHEGFSNLSQAVSGAELIFVCSPVDTIPKIISEIDHYAQKGTIVTDVGSTKGMIVRWAANKRFRNIQFIGSHPLAGSHLTGMEHAKADLFKGAFIFVTPIGSSRQAKSKMTSFWKKIGGKVRIVTPEVHDQIVSEVSHLPHALASILIHSVSQKSLAYAASGFLDTTRIAQGDPRLWVPIFLTNRKNIISDLKRFERQLHRFLACLNQDSNRSIQNFLKIAARKRTKIR